MTAEKCKNNREVFHDVILEVSEDDIANDYDSEGLDDYSYLSYGSKRTKYDPGRGFVRYSAALKHLLPYRKKQKKKNVIEVDNAGLFSYATFSWMSHYIYQAKKKGLTFQDIPLCSPYESSELNSQRLAVLWQAEINTRGLENASFGRVSWKFIQTRLLVCSFIYVMHCMIAFISPAIFMRKLIEFSQDTDAETLDGVIWAFAFSFFELLKTLSLAMYHNLSYRTGVRLRAACLVLIYRKIMGLQSLGPKSIGQVVSMFGGDGSRVFHMVVFGPMIIGAPIVVVCCACYIYFILGGWALIGLTAMILFYPLQFGLSRLQRYFRRRSLRKTDERIRLITEVLSAIKLIKIYAWDVCFLERLQEVRKEELSLLKKGSYCQNIGHTLAPAFPVITGVLTFLIHILTGGNLNAAQAYPLITLLHSQLRTSLLNLRHGTDNIIEGLITFGRIQEILSLEDMPPPIPKPADKTMALTMNEGVFRWSEPVQIIKNGLGAKKEADVELDKLNEKKEGETFTLDSINLCVSKGSLIGICGPIGSGKTSLLRACLGHMKKISGEVHRAGRCAYVSQEAWIENATLKENVLFGEPFSQKKYVNAMYCCALNDDVNALPDRDETEIGERGVNLSGGQKQRVSLARALYANRDIYFLDDPLSAVDSQVGAHIFDKYILGALNKKTVFLVTHQMKFLQKCDEILVMNDGKIVERGTHHELLSLGRVYSQMVDSCMLMTWQTSQESEENIIKTEDGKTDEKNNVTKRDRLPPKKYMQAEEQRKGQVKKSVYQTYINSAGGYFICFFVCAVILLNVGSTTFSSWWLAFWLKAGSGNSTIVDPSTNETVISPYLNDNPDSDFYIQIYACIIGLICATTLLKGLIFTNVTIRASRVLHYNYLKKMISGRLRYFEVTPIGRIQSIFSKDFNDIDVGLPRSMGTLIQNMWLIVFAFLSIILVFPWFLVPLGVIAIFYYLIGKIFRVAIRDFRRIEAISRTPIFSLVTATVNGLPIIHSFNKENQFLSIFYQRYDENSVCIYLSNCAMRWMAIRLDFISVAITLITSTMSILQKGNVVPAMVGLALSYASHLSGMFQYTLRLMSETEAKFIGIERVQTSSENIVTEMNPKETVEVPENWPSDGSIKFKNVRLSYSSDLPTILNDITFAVQGGEKIGVVGRTGAGKSSLVTAVFRLVELSHGTIHIDNVDISSVRLQVLRSRLSVIPQDPVVFNGTLRFNLDPFNKYGDDIIWEVLRQTKLITKVQSMVNGLSTEIGEGGENLSVGESQLLCLARALLRESKILILDEATASVDPDTETAVQTTIDENFKNCTVFTIAHRLQTLKNCTKVLVLHDGVVQEFGDPEKLLENSNSLFSKMVRVLK